MYRLLMVIDGTSPHFFCCRGFWCLPSSPSGRRCRALGVTFFPWLFRSVSTTVPWQKRTLYIPTCIYMCVCVCLYMYVYIYIYVCMYIYIYIVYVDVYCNLVCMYLTSTFFYDYVFTVKYFVYLRYVIH